MNAERWSLPVEPVELPPFPDPEDESGNFLDETPFDPDGPDNWVSEDVDTDGPFYEIIDGIRVPLPYDEDVVLRDREIYETDDPDDNPYGIVYDQRSKRIPSTTHEVLSDAAYDVGDTQAWQLLGIRGSLDRDLFIVDVLSKGPVPPIRQDLFGDIADFVTVDAEPSDEQLKIHGLKFEGTRAQMDDFLIFLREKLAYTVGEDENPLDHLRVPLPWITFWAIAGRKQSDS